MKFWRPIAAIPMALLASQALAANWVTVGADKDELSTYVDKDSIRHGSDGLIYFNTTTDAEEDASRAADCQKRIDYLLHYDDHLLDHPSNYPDWRDHGDAVSAGTLGEAEFDYVCANAP